MTRTFAHGSALGVVLGTLALATPAMAAPVGTQVGETILNEVTVNYNIGSGPDAVAQDPVEAQDEVAVDRKINLTVARTDNTGTQVTPGETGAAVTYVVTNESNDAVDFQLDATNVATGTASELDGTASDNFDATGGFTYYLDNPSAGTPGVFDASDTVITHIDALPSGDSAIIHVVSNIEGGLSTDDRAAITLSAIARVDDGTTALGGSFTVATANSADPLTVDTVFADTDADGQIANDGAAFDTDDYVVLAAGLTATKSSAVVVGAFGGDNSGTYLPGATMEYCILVANVAGSATATNVTISDTLPAEVTYVPAFGVRVGGADCATPGGTAGTFSGGVVSGTIGSLAGGEQQSLIFRATIN
ncbi:hypothetical protein ACFCW2_00585 [Qipengyuania sp. DSG2-2]|uniref:hypothetical protein n=1 Tax=Qipengyuania sp. DGS2-2 TaxID=3349631 RepID=UPI0036D3ABCC